ncbi:MAG TPA: VOC family protein [Streptosporangiaceae bacterium]|nr:VOC family protein [Streptosporangiaceae bacterium]
MQARIDHIVLWVEDPARSLDFYEQVIGLEPVRRDEFAAGRAPFPSVRVAADSLIDLMARMAAPAVSQGTKAEGTAGHPVNHLCLAMSAAEYQALKIRLHRAGVDTSAGMQQTFGARGIAPHAFYFRDPDDNVIEARYYAD